MTILYTWTPTKVKGEYYNTIHSSSKPWTTYKTCITVKWQKTEYCCVCFFVIASKKKEVEKEGRWYIMHLFSFRGAVLRKCKEEIKEVRKKWWERKAKEVGKMKRLEGGKAHLCQWFLVGRIKAFPVFFQLSMCQLNDKQAKGLVDNVKKTLCEESQKSNNKI